MKKISFYIFTCIMLLNFSLKAQVTSKKVENVDISTTKAVYLGKSVPVRDAVPKLSTPKSKKQKSKLNKQVPNNFKGRKNRSSSVDLSKEHNVDLVLQSELKKNVNNQLEILVNTRGRGQGSPTDPTGDISDQYYVQAVNATDVGVYNLSGALIMSFPMNTLWAQFGVGSLGDPIILYDEITDKWILTEFTGPANLLIAVSDTNDPLGSYNAYNFTTPNFPDYPKYALTPEALVVTTNEEGRGTLHQYFINKAELVAGAGDATIQRIALAGSNGTEQGFYVSTPADLNGPNMPFDNNPIVMRLNDSSWPGGPQQDGIELYSFEIDFENANNTQIIQTSIPTAPYDAFPCSVGGPGFQCIPQRNGGGLDGIPEIIMNVPHQRNFGTHESLVYTHTTDVENGGNRAGVRWVELRRTSAEGNWSVFQEGTFALDDGLNRFMSSVAMDSKGNICLGYSTSSDETFADLRVTGRRADDPLGEMTFNEEILQEGLVTINSGGRFGDYPQMSVAPGGIGSFWFTSEYAGPFGTVTNIAAIRMRDTFDLATRKFISPTPDNLFLTTTEAVTVEVVNAGVNPISDFTLELQLDGVVVSTSQISDTLQPNEVLTHTYPDDLDLTVNKNFTLISTVLSPLDQIPLNNPLTLNLSLPPDLETSIEGRVNPSQCDGTIQGTIVLENLGLDIITSANIGATVNGVAQPDLTYTGSISLDQTANIDFSFPAEVPGTYTLEFEIISINDASEDFDLTNNTLTFEVESLDQDNFVIVTLLTDNFPDEISYTIISQATGQVVAEFGGLVRDEDNNTTITNRVCLDVNECYSISINDSGGDGFCCDEGEGSLSITDRDGNLIALSTGEFGGSTFIPFCALAQECALLVDIETMDTNPSSFGTGVILINVTGGVPPYQYSIDGGATFSTNNQFTSLTAANYEVVVRDATETCIHEEIVPIIVPTSTHQINGTTVNVDILPNPTEGVFKINIGNLPTKANFAQINIYDINGKLVQQRDIGKFDDNFIGTFSLYAFPAGTYLIRIVTPELNILERVVKQ